MAPNKRNCPGFEGVVSPSWVASAMQKHVKAPNQLVKSNSCSSQMHTELFNSNF